MTPFVGVGRRRGAGAAVREDLVDHRPLGSERDEAHRAVAGGGTQRVDFNDLRQQRGLLAVAGST